MTNRKGRTMASILLAGLLLCAASNDLRAADCSGTTVDALLDATAAYDDIDHDVIVPAIEAMAAGLEGDQRLIVRTAGDALGAALNSWRVSLSRRRRRSATGLPRPIATQVGALPG